MIHELEASTVISPSPFYWSKYLSIVDERAISEEFFDHYFASIQSDLQSEMIVEYCYDVENDHYWYAQIQLVSDRFIRLHYWGIPDQDTEYDFWASIYDGRSHRLGWCKENEKKLIPPKFLEEFNEHLDEKNVDFEEFSTPPAHVFDQVSISKKNFIIIRDVFVSFRTSV